MPRQAREESGTGIFHVMMRGINHQAIFEDEEDYYQFIIILDRMRVRYDDEGNPSGSNCTYYAYCLMSNHFHILIRVTNHLWIIIVGVIALLGICLRFKESNLVSPIKRYKEHIDGQLLSWDKRHPQYDKLKEELELLKGKKNTIEPI